MGHVTNGSSPGKLGRGLLRAWASGTFSKRSTKGTIAGAGSREVSCLGPGVSDSLCRGELMEHSAPVLAGVRQWRSAAAPDFQAPLCEAQLGHMQQGLSCRRRPLHDVVLCARASSSTYTTGADSMCDEYLAASSRV